MRDAAAMPSRAPTSKRLTFEPLTSADLGVFHELVVDPHVRRYLMDGQVMTATWTAEAIAASDALFAARGVGLWLLREGDAVVGFAGFRVFAEMAPEPQLIYALRESATSRGLATEAAEACLRFAAWPTVLAAVDAPNGASTRVLEKLGFVHAGRLDGVFGDTWLMRLGERVRRTVACTWDGQPVGPDERVEVTLWTAPGALHVEVDAPFHDDPPPPPGADLWNHEVVEVFLLGRDERYLEIELGPHGHTRVLALRGVRTVERDHLEIAFEVQRTGGRWRGHAVVDAALLPPELRRLNVYAIHGVGAARRYLACHPVPGEAPDFHRLECFGPYGDPASGGGA